MSKLTVVLGLFFALMFLVKYYESKQKREGGDTSYLKNPFVIPLAILMAVMWYIIIASPRSRSAKDDVEEKPMSDRDLLDNYNRQRGQEYLDDMYRSGRHKDRVILP